MDPPEEVDTVAPAAASQPPGAPPPAYPVAPIKTAADLALEKPLRGQKPANYLSINRVKIAGDFIIDPTIHVPTALLPTLEPGAVRKNLILTCTQKSGTINACIWLVGPNQGRFGGGQPKRQNTKARALIAVKSELALVDLKVRRFAPVPFTLEVQGSGRCSVSLPRSFHGPLTLSGYDINALSISKELKANVMTISETPHSLDAFVGDVTGWEQAGADTTGNSDRCTIRVVSSPHAKIEVRYVDELQPVASTSSAVPASNVTSPSSSQFFMLPAGMGASRMSSLRSKGSHVWGKVMSKMNG